MDEVLGPISDPGIVFPGPESITVPGINARALGVEGISLIELFLTVL
jgi:hypothetical protein